MHNSLAICTSLFLLLSPSTAQPRDQRPPSLATADIQHTLNTFSTAVDTHNFTLLAAVFAPDATANFDDAHGELAGLASISAALQTGLAGQRSWHALSTQVVEFSGARTASATSYLQGTFFGQGNLTGQIFTTYGRYLDALELTGLGWRITRKTLARTGTIGNANILG